MRGFVRRITALRDERDQDQGAALVMTIIIGMVLLALVATATTVALSGVRKSGTDADWNAAMSAAYAGIEDYQSRLSNDNTYVRYGNPNAPFTIQSGSRTTVALPATANAAFGIGSTGAWASVPRSGGAARYRYEVDNSQYSAVGTVRLRATGMVGSSVRSLVVNVKQQGFIDFLYFTDYEMIDPVQVDDSTCRPHYAWSRSSNTHYNCSSIQFFPGDVFNGPVHSNDTMRMCGGTFNGEVTTSNSKSPVVVTPTGCTGAAFTVPGFPKYSMTVKMPQSNQELRKEYRTDLTGTTVPRPGCLYTGPTVITFLESGKMNVKSPFTLKTQIANEDATIGSSPSMCGTPGTTVGALGSASGATIDVLPQNLVYVQDVPTTSSNVNFWRSSDYPDQFRCDGRRESIPSRWNFGVTPSSSSTNSTSTFVRYPLGDEVAPYGSPPHYSCRKGDAYVKGKVHGAMTIATENYIYVTGNLEYVDDSEDVLGLIGQNAVWVWNPVTEGGSNLLPAGDRVIDAAILSVAHTFMVQNYNRGSYRGKLQVTGAIAQKFRGTVATGTGTTVSTGYAKEYSYDDRLKYMAPPKFLSPVSTTYGVSEIVEVKTAFRPDGSAAP